MGLAMGSLAALAIAWGPGTAAVEWLTDNTVNPPGVPGAFAIERTIPVPCGEFVVYDGTRTDIVDYNDGLYAASATGVFVIADSNTAVVGGGGATVPLADEGACDEGRVLFVGVEEVPATGSHLYEWEHMAGIERALSAGTPVAGSTLTSVGNVDAADGTAVLDARLFPTVSNQVLILLSPGGSPSAIVDRTMVMPGQVDPVTIFAEPLVDGSAVVFHARTDGALGFYRWRPGSGLELVVDTATPVPLPGAGNFLIFDVAATVVDQGVVFGAGYSGGFGLFLATDGGISPLVIPGDLTETGETIVRASLPTGRGSFVAFIARTVERPRDAVYVRSADGRLTRLLGIEDVVDGKVINTVMVGADDRTVAIRTDSFGPPWIQTIYRARIEGANPVEIPALSAAGSAALLAVLAAVGVALLRFRAQAGA